MALAEILSSFFGCQMAVEYATGVGYPEAKAMADRIATFSGN